MTKTDNTTAIPLLGELGKLIEQYKLPGVDVAALMEWQRKDMEALAEANRKGFEGAKALIDRHNQMLAETLAQCQVALTNVSGADGFSKQAELARETVQKAVSNLQELSQIAGTARGDAWKVIQDRLQENFTNFQKLFQPK